MGPFVCEKNANWSLFDRWTENQPNPTSERFYTQAEYPRPGTPNTIDAIKMQVHTHRTGWGVPGKLPTYKERPCRAFLHDTTRCDTRTLLFTFSRNLKKPEAGLRFVSHARSSVNQTFRRCCQQFSSCVGKQNQKNQGFTFTTQSKTTNPTEDILYLLLAPLAIRHE